MLHWHTNATSMVAEADGCSYVIRAKLSLDGFMADAINRHTGVKYLGEYGTIAEAGAVCELHHRTTATPAQLDDPHDPVIRPWHT